MYQNELDITFVADLAAALGVAPAQLLCNKSGSGGPPLRRTSAAEVGLGEVTRRSVAAWGTTKDETNLLFAARCNVREIRQRSNLATLRNSCAPA